MSRIGPIAVLGLLIAVPARAQDLTREIDDIFSWTTPDAPGCVVGASKEGRQVVNRAYGLADLEGALPLTPASILDIGSVQKQFVAAAVLLLVEDGRVSLTDDIRRFFPELPDYGHTIRVDHLLTHTSGIRDWTGLLAFSREDEDALTAILRQRGLNFAPGEEWSYSNSGFVLLKELVARTSGMSFSDFARTRLFEPLGMQSTRYTTEDLADIEDLAPAYDKQGDVWRRAMMLGNERGGGALLSTAGDLLIWNEALTNARLGAFVSEKLVEPARLSNGRQLRYGRAVMLYTNRGGRVLWHGGSADGYKAFLGRFPEQGISIAILCNAGEAADGVTAYARRIYELLVPEVAALDYEDRPDAADGAAAADVDVSARAGLFFNERTGQPLRLGVDDGRLRIVGGPALVTLAADRFRNPEASLSFMSDDEFELRFVSADEFELRSMEGDVTRYRRARPWSPTGADLQSFAGRYESDELDAIFDLAPGGNGLTVRLNESQTIEFAPVDVDTFQWRMMTLRLRRDEAGNVVALDYSNPVFRNVTFTRTSNR